MIRRLHEGDAETYLEFRRASLLESPLAFASSPDDDFASSIDELREHLQRAPRSRGVGWELIQSVLRHARMLEGVLQVQLSVTEDAQAARRLYERAGFRLWGTEPDSLCHQGRSVVEQHMQFCLWERRRPEAGADRIGYTVSLRG